MKKNEFREPQYSELLRCLDEIGYQRLGIMANQAWYDDPRRLAFTLSRYKFVSKMFSNKQNVLEIGCGDGFASRIVLQEVGSLTLSDFDPSFIEEAKQMAVGKWQFKDCVVHDMTESDLPGSFDGIYALDVFEHIPPEKEELFLENTVKSLAPNGTLIIGIPSLESQDYSSESSRIGHVNCKSMPDLKSLLDIFFSNTFMFSMNDEVVHTGFHKMAHYLFAICSSPKTDGTDKG